MACRLCQLEIAMDLCEVCKYLTEEDLPVLPSTCRSCGAPIGKPSEWEVHCQVCRALLKNVRENEWFVRAHAEWEKENIQFARLKQELLGQGGSSIF